MAALFFIGDRPRFIEDNLEAFLYSTELPDREWERGQHVYFDGEGNVVDDAGARLVEDHALAAKAHIIRGEWEEAAVEAGRAVGVLADLAVFGHVMMGEEHHSDYEAWVEEAVQRGLWSWDWALDGAPSDIDAVPAYIPDSGGFIIHLGNVAVRGVDRDAEQLDVYEAALDMAHSTWTGQGMTAMELDMSWNASALWCRDQAVEAISSAVEVVGDLLDWFRWTEKSWRGTDGSVSGSMQIVPRILVCLAVLMMGLITLAGHGGRGQTR